MSADRPQDCRFFELQRRARMSRLLSLAFAASSYLLHVREAARSRWFSERKVTVILRLLKRLFAPKLFGPKILADPYPYYARLRSTAPVYWVDQFDAWVLTRYADVTAVLRS